ncbi:MAG: class I SAM-dependent methyltransferase [Chloroflexota bacterium]|nr:class I SAM-dependent methyltransferase [Chloroflexota bacterium]
MGNIVDTDLTEQLHKSWRANAAAWTTAVRESAIQSRRAGTDAAILSAMLEHQPTCVLDLGCGEGWLARVLAAHGVEVVGVDASEPLIRAAKEAGGGDFHALTYSQLLQMESEQLGGRFDAVVFNFALLEESLDAALACAHRFAAENGVMMIQTVHPWTARGELPYEDGWRTERFSSFGGEFREPMPWFFRTLQSWTDVIRGAGFQLKSLREPVHPETGDPLSLIIVAKPRTH